MARERRPRSWDPFHHKGHPPAAVRMPASGYSTHLSPSECVRPIVATGLTCGWWQQWGSPSPGWSPMSSRSLLAKQRWKAVLPLANHWVAPVLTWSSKSLVYTLPWSPLPLSFLPFNPIRSSAASFPFSSGSVASMLLTPRSRMSEDP